MEWGKTNKRFVGFFDIMGFKELVQRHPHNYVYEKLHKIRSFAMSYEDHDEKIKKIDPNHKKSTVRHILFSDSVLFISNSDSEIDAEHFINRCNHFVWNCFYNEIPIKGGLSHGTFTADFENSIFFGQPLIDAYLLQEDVLFYGGIFDNNIEKRIQELNSTNELFLNRFYSYEVPMRSGKITHFCLKWLSRSSGDMAANRELVLKFYNTVSGKPRIYVDNTLKFTDWVINKVNNAKDTRDR